MPGLSLTPATPFLWIAPAVSQVPDLISRRCSGPQDPPYCTLAWIAFLPTLQSSLEDPKSHFFFPPPLVPSLCTSLPPSRWGPLTLTNRSNRRARRCKGSCFCLHVHKTPLPRAIEPRLRYQLYKQSDGVSLLRCLRRSTLGYVYTAAIIPVDSTMYNTGDRDLHTCFQPEVLGPMT